MRYLPYLGSDFKISFHKAIDLISVYASVGSSLVEYAKCTWVWILFWKISSYFSSLVCETSILGIFSDSFL